MRKMGRAGTAREKRNCWMRGNGAHSLRGELKVGRRMESRQNNRRVRHMPITDDSVSPRGSHYKRVNAKAAFNHLIS